jgi:transposase-like protein
MLDMSKKNGAGPPRPGSAAAVREAARASTPLTPATPERPKRRTFTAEFKQRILREADVALATGTDGAIGELLRREGLYSSHLTEWRRQRDAGERAGLTPQKRGRRATRSAHADEMERLQRRVALLETELKKAETIIDVQKKLSLLLGVTLPAPTEEDFTRADTRRRR